MESIVSNLTTAITPFLELIIFALNLFSIAILLWGIVIFFIDFFKKGKLQKDRLAMVKQNDIVKSILGSYILLSLEVLIASDIIESILRPTFQDLFILASIVIIRTVISYFLHKEIDQTIEEETHS